MDSRPKLQDLLEEILGSQEVYFQPPESVKMSYPAIRYTLSDIDNQLANNKVYQQKLKYEITVIDRRPDGEIFLKVSRLPYCRFIRHYKADKLNHYLFEYTENNVKEVTDDSYLRGFDEGYNKGKSDGYDDGYDHGHAEGRVDGVQAEYDFFWDNYQEYGKRRNYQYAFYGQGWNDEIFKPKYPLVLTYSFANYLFANSKITKFDNLDFSQCNAVLQVFASSAVEEINCVLDFSKVLPGQNGLNQTFYSCSVLRKIQKIVLPTASTKLDAFTNNRSLTDVTFEGTIYQNINFQSSPLSVASMKNIISCLNNYSGTSNEYTYRVVFTDDCWAALEADSIAPTGTTWADYVNSLGWNT